MTLMLLLLACAPKPAAPGPTAAAPAITVEKPEAAPIVAPTPGLNDRFLDPEAELQPWIERFEAESREVVARQADVLAQLALQPGEVVADIGAGTGLYTAAFSAAVGDDGAVYAVDISPVFLEHLRVTAADEGWDNVQVVEGSADAVNLQEDSIDVAFICDTYHHFEQPAETLASLQLALKPGGRLYLLDFERIEGVSRDFIMGHVRAGKETFAAEVEAAGFTPDGQLDAGLTENYLLRFLAP